MLEPQSTVLFLLLLVVFVGLVAWMALARQPVFRVFAACLAFIPAMLFGVAAVNKYYDYYQTWGAMAADLGGQGTTQVASAPTMDRASARQISAILGSKVNLKAAAEHGQTIRMTVPGKLSHLSRTAYVYLPPQYFQAGYSRFHFPVIELFPGFPGSPVDWINVMGFTTAYAALLADGVVKPAVLVMPDTNGGVRISLQCLNVRHGPQDATYLAVDLPSYLPTVLRVQPPGRPGAWLATRRAGTAPPTWPWCTGCTGARPASSAATSPRARISSATRRTWSTRSATTSTRCARTRRGCASPTSRSATRSRSSGWAWAAGTCSGCATRAISSGC